MAGKAISRNSVAIIEKSLHNFHRVHSDLVRSSATLKDRAAINMAAWTGGVFETGKKSR
jgi:hypothetical protein